MGFTESKRKECIFLRRTLNEDEGRGEIAFSEQAEAGTAGHPRPRLGSAHGREREGQRRGAHL